MADGKVLIVDDDPAVGKSLGLLLKQAKIEWRHVASGEAALDMLEREPFDVVVTDIRMDGMSGMQVLDECRRRWPGMPVVVITAHGTVALAVDAMKVGAVDFVLKPFEKDEILFVIDKALRSAEHSADVAPVAVALPTSGFIGDSALMREVYALIEKVAKSDTTVLVRGETGTGKEVTAHAIHDSSRRASGPFVVVHCGALPENLLESELFGYEKGAFTGAVVQKPGRMELADGGTVFLDEIGDVPLSTQVKLLRVIQERSFERVGGTETIEIDVRFVAATHRNLEEMIEEGTFREDLYYRLNVVPLWVPPLRERPEDVEALAKHFCAEFAARNARPEVCFDDAALGRLAQEAWPGNVRQLQNFVERMVVLADEDLLGLPQVERELGRGTAGGGGGGLRVTGGTGTLAEQTHQAERGAIERALEKSGQNRTVAARILGISRRTLYNKLEEYGIR